MLLGAIIGLNKKDIKFNIKTDFLKLILSIILFYGILFAGRKNAFVAEFQIVSLIPLLFTTFYFYKICNSKLLKGWYDNKIFGYIIKLIGGLCLEIYLVQYSLFTDKNEFYISNKSHFNVRHYCYCCVYSQMWSKNIHSNI